MHDEDRYVGQFPPVFSRIHQDKDLWWVVPMRVRYILGVTGYRYTGKSRALAHLAEQRGFRLYTLSWALRQEAQRLGQPMSPRSRLQDLGDRLREDSGDAGYLARKTLRAIRAEFLAHQTGAGAPPRIAVGGFKRPEEVDVFASIPEFRLIAITAEEGGVDNRALRFERGLVSGGLGREVAEAGGDPDGDLAAQFRPIDDRDLYGQEGDDSYGQAVEKVVAKVDHPIDRIVNTADGEDQLYIALDQAVRRLDAEYRLPRGF